MSSCCGDWVGLRGAGQLLVSVEVVVVSQGKGSVCRWGFAVVVLLEKEWVGTGEVVRLTGELVGL